MNRQKISLPQLEGQPSLVETDIPSPISIPLNSGTDRSPPFSVYVTGDTIKLTSAFSCKSLDGIDILNIFLSMSAMLNFGRVYF